MKQRTSAELLEITTTFRDAYKSDAIIAAHKELERRNLNESELSEAVNILRSKEKELEKIKAENTSLENEERFQKIFNEGPLGMCVTSPGFRIKQVNETFCKMLGYTEDELLQLTTNDITLPMQLIKDNDALKKLSRGEINVFRKEKQYVRKDGNVFWGSLTASALHDNNGNFLNYFCMIEDITDRKNAERALFKNKHFLDSLVESLNVGISVVNKSGVRIMTNQALSDMTGFSREELLYAPPPFKLWPPEYAEAFKKDFTSMLFGSFIECERVFMRKNEERFPVLLSPSYIRNEQGELEYFIVSIKDISNQKTAELKLKQSEEKYRRLVEDINIGIFQSTPGGKFIHANSTVIKIAGYNDWEDFKNVTADQLYYEPADRIRFINEMSQKGFVSNFEVKSQKKDKSIYWINISAIPLKDPNGKIISFLGSVVEITERKKAEQELRESEQRFRHLTDASFEAIVIHEKGILLEANQNAEKMFGYDLSELIGMSVADLAYQESKQIVMNNTLAGYEKTYEATALRKDGSTFPTELIGRMIPYHGRTARVTAIRDISAKKKAEEELKISEEQFRMLFQSSPIGKAVSDREGNLLLYNDAILHIGGFTKEDIKKVGNIVNMYYNPADRDRVVEIAVKQNGLFEFPLVFKHKNGAPYDALLTLTPFRFQGKDCWQVIVEKININTTNVHSLQKK